jgi:hypothetical protein
MGKPILGTPHHRMLGIEELEAVYVGMSASGTSATRSLVGNTTEKVPGSTIPYRPGWCDTIHSGGDKSENNYAVYLLRR